MGKRYGSMILAALCASMLLTAPSSSRAYNPPDDMRDLTYNPFTTPDGKYIHSVHVTKDNYRRNQQEFSTWCKDKAHGTLSVQRDRPFDGWTKVKCELEDGLRDYYAVTYNRDGQSAEGELRLVEMPKVALDGIWRVFGAPTESPHKKGVFIWRKQYHIFNLDTESNTWTVIPKKIGQFW